MNELFKSYTVEDIIRLGGSRYLKGLLDKEFLSEYIKDLKFYVDTYPMLERATFHELFMFSGELLDIHRAVTTWCKAQQVTPEDIELVKAGLSEELVDGFKMRMVEGHRRSYNENTAQVRKLQEQASAYSAQAMRNLQKVEEAERAFSAEALYASVAEASKSYFVHFDSSGIYLIDLHDISITHDAGAVGSKQRILGKFLYHINTNGQLKVYPWANNLVGNNQYWHPHVSSGGQICLGEGAYAFIESYPLVGKMMKIVRAIMTTYNASSPYIALSYMRKIKKGDSYVYNSYPISPSFIGKEFVRAYYAKFGTIPCQNYSVFSSFMGMVSVELGDGRFDDIDNETIIEALNPAKEYTLSEIDDVVKKLRAGEAVAEPFTASLPESMPSVVIDEASSITPALAAELASRLNPSSGYNYTIATPAIASFDYAEADSMDAADIDDGSSYSTEVEGGTY